MIDLHSHVVWGYDDGAADAEESLAMARMYVDDGVQTVAATPHVGGWSWGAPPTDLDDRCAGLRERFAAEGIPLELVPGAEIYITADAVKNLKKRAEGHRPLGNSRYVLVEFSLGGTDRYVEEAFFALQSAGWRVVLAHAERYVSLQRKPEKLAQLLERGVLAQVTTGSLLGEFGSDARRLAEQLVELDLCAIVATDAHRVHTRKPSMARARERLIELAGEVTAERLTKTNPARILADEGFGVTGDPSELQGRQKSFFGTLFR